MESIISNKNSNTPWRRLLAISVLAALFALASTISAAAGPKSAAHGSTCPDSNALGNFQAASNVAASFSNSGNTTTYSFVSLTNENPFDGVPGLIKYCVYPTSDTPPTEIIVSQTGWIYRAGSPDFSFGRPQGNPSNIPLDGQTTVMGTATWSDLLAAPTDQTILLHINDPSVCANLYGDNPGTCFVKPSQACACDKGDTTLAYNAMPWGVVNCGPPSEAFEAQATNEFGDRVELAAGTGRELVSLSVSFNSYGCETGHWYDGSCDSTPGANFTHRITAKIYNTTGTLLATISPTQTIPFRPAADGDAHGCPDPAQWWNPDGDCGVGRCQYSIVKVLTFDFPPGTTLPDDVVWSVAFNTSHSGYDPLGEGTICYSQPGGCGYDSLNVSTKSFTGAPYSGLDLNGDEVYWGGWRNPGTHNGNMCYPPPWSPTCSEVFFSSELGWSTNRPLGAITTK